MTRLVTGDDPRDIEIRRLRADLRRAEEELADLSQRLVHAFEEIRNLRSRIEAPARPTSRS